ncbi:MAG: TlyA family RNA methyltransferase [Anaerolineae bacterium]|nr:TlyA family RNA methyltransferase [Anaerolineae bacterium]
MANQTVRLDILMVEKGLVESRSLAQRLVMAGEVRVNGQVQIKPGVRVAKDVEVHIDAAPRFVSRGGDKLEPALLAFNCTNLQGVICADVGASTGGFTDCLLQYGASQVFAIDVGYGILHWKLRTDPRVIVMERTNARYVEVLPQPVTLVTIDASFISLRILLPVVKGWFGADGGSVIALIKPQFEAGKKDAARNDGVIRDAAVHVRVLRELAVFVEEIGFSIGGLLQSPVKGPKGNIEFLILLHSAPGLASIDIQQQIEMLFPCL